MSSARLSGGGADVVQEATGNEPVASTSEGGPTQEPAMTLEQFKEQLAELNKGLRSLPATAQVSSSLAATHCPPEPVLVTGTFPSWDNLQRL